MSAKPEPDACGNPFRGKKCGRPDIAVLINVKGKIIPICTQCWYGNRKNGSDGLGESNHQWGEWGTEEFKDEAQ